MELNSKNLITSNFKLGIIGGGQLAKMLIQVANSWDIQTHILDPSPSCPAVKNCSEFVQGDFLDYSAVYNFGKTVDMLTVELDHANADALLKLQEEGTIVRPNPEALRIIQDKGIQKQFYEKHNIPTSAFQLADDSNHIKELINSGSIKFPFVQKSRKFGYDGQGVQLIKNNSELDKLFNTASLIEDVVDIKKEISIIVARNVQGQIKHFPPVEMVFNQEANLVDYLMCPANISEAQLRLANELATTIAKELNYIGILAVEMFLDQSDNISINEVAPRPHNSGHHTIESVITSQYEQHLRAIFGFDLGSTALKIPAVMVNILGDTDYQGPVKYEGLVECMSIEGAKFHIYGKKETRPFRKMGHATILDRSIESALEKAKVIKQKLKVIS